MKKILLLSTGGTIASAMGIDGLAPSLTATEILGLVPEIRHLCDIDCEDIFSLDSSNIQPEEWGIIGRKINEKLQDYDGVVLLHGTDTMAYTSSILSFMFRNMNKPIIITGSQMPLAVPGNDARSNVWYAFLAAVSDIRGVFVVFGGKIIRGCRAIKVRSMAFNAFESINSTDYGYFENGELVIHTKEKYEPAGELMFNDRINPNVFLLKIVPGSRLEFFEVFKRMGYAGLVIEGFGLGGMHYIRRNLTEGICWLIEAGIPVVVTTQCPYETSNLTVYEVGRKLLSAGVIPGYDMTFTAAVTKMMWALGQTTNLDEIKDIMLRNYCGEISR